MRESAENGALAEAADIDAELRELQSFVLIETGHAPTVNAVAALRSRIAKTLGHSDPWCVAHCRPGVKHSACGCRCGQHRRRPIPPGDCNCGWGGVHDPDNPRCAANGAVLPPGSDTRGGAA